MSSELDTRLREYDDLGHASFKVWEMNSRVREYDKAMALAPSSFPRRREFSCKGRCATEKEASVQYLYGT
jgi:hypothetical protein